MTAVLVALLAASSFALSTVLQHRAAAAGPPAGGSLTGLAGPTGLIGLVRHLAGRPLWLLGAFAGAAGLVLHALALRVGPVVVVQPLLVMGLPLSLAAGAVLDRRRPTRAQSLAALAATCGLASFLLSAQPQTGNSLGKPGVLLASSLGALVVIASAMLWGRLSKSSCRAPLLGAAAGAGFGMTGVLLKQVVGTPAGQLMRTWPLLALVVVGLPAVAVAQLAFQSGSLSSCLPAMTMMEPLVAGILGAVGFAEHLSGSVGARSGQTVGLLLTLGAVIRLAALQDRLDAQDGDRSSWAADQSTAALQRMASIPPST